MVTHGKGMRMATEDKQEIELRLEITEDDAVRLAQLMPSSDRVTSEVQEDTYFDTDTRTWSARDPVFKWLRLRQTKSGAELNMKIFDYSADGRTTGCTELGVSVSSLETTKAILSHLGFSELIHVRKVRASWMMRDVLICIDEVEDLGRFVELEATVSHGDYTETLRYLKSFAGQLGLSGREPDARGYPYSLIRRAHPFV